MSLVVAFLSVSRGAGLGFFTRFLLCCRVNGATRIPDCSYGFGLRNVGIGPVGPISEGKVGLSLL